MGADSATLSPPQADRAPESPIRYTCTVVAMLAMTTAAAMAQVMSGFRGLFAPFAHVDDREKHGDHQEADREVEHGVAQLRVSVEKVGGMGAVFEPFSGVGGERSQDRGDRGEDENQPGEVAAGARPQGAHDREDGSQWSQYHDEVNEQDVCGKTLERGQREPFFGLPSWRGGQVMAAPMRWPTT